MLSIKFVNDNTGNDEMANYNVVVAVNNRIVHRGRAEMHYVSSGWRKLVELWLKEEKWKESSLYKSEPWS